MRSRGSCVEQMPFGNARHFNQTGKPSYISSRFDDLACRQHHFRLMCGFERGANLMTRPTCTSTGMKCPIAQVEATGPCAPYRQDFVLIKQVKSTILIDFYHRHLKGLRLDLREIKQLNGHSRENAPIIRNGLPRTLCSFQLCFCAYSRRPKDAVRFAADRELDGRFARVSSASKNYTYLPVCP